MYNRGKTENKQIPGESDAEFAKRCEEVKTIVGDRKDPEVSNLFWAVHGMALVLFFAQEITFDKKLNSPKCWYSIVSNPENISCEGNSA